MTDCRFIFYFQKALSSSSIYAISHKRASHSIVVDSYQKDACQWWSKWWFYLPWPLFCKLTVPWSLECIWPDINFTKVINAIVVKSRKPQFIRFISEFQNTLSLLRSLVPKRRIYVSNPNPNQNQRPVFKIVSTILPDIKTLFHIRM